MTLVAGLLVLGTPAAIAAPRRIVSINLCTDEYVFRLVPRSRIAALSVLAGDHNPVVSTIADEVAGIPHIRQTSEEVLGLKPDLVVLDAGTSMRVRAHLMAANVPVLEVPFAATLQDVRRVTRLLGEKLGAPDRAAALIAAMDADLAEARVLAPRPPVRALIYEPNGYATGGGVTGEIMRAGGLADAAAGLKPTRLGTIPIETIVGSAPELLILAGRRDAQRSRADLVLHHPAFSRLDGTDIVWAATTPLLCPGPWSARMAVTFAKLAAKARALAPAAHAK